MSSGESAGTSFSNTRLALAGLDEQSAHHDGRRLPLTVYRCRRQMSVEDKWTGGMRMERKTGREKKPRSSSSRPFQSNQEFLDEYVELLKSLCLVRLGRKEGEEGSQDITHDGLPGCLKRSSTAKPYPELLRQYREKVKLFRSRIMKTISYGSVNLPLVQISNRYRLSEFEETVLISIMAYSANRGFEHLVDEVTACGRISVRALLRFLCDDDVEARSKRDLLLPSGKLVRNGLMVIGSRRNWSTLSDDDFLSMTPEVPLSIANIILDIGYSELHSGSLRLIDPNDSLKDSSLSEEILDKIQRVVEFEQKMDTIVRSDDRLAEHNRIVLLYGPPGAGKRRAARIIAARLGKKLLRIRTSRFLMHDCDDLEEVKRVLDHSDVSRAVPCFVLAERLLDEDQDDGLSESFAEAFAEFGNTVILTVNSMPGLTGNLGKHVTHFIPITLPPLDHRISIIRDSIPAGLPLAPNADLRGIADRLELSTVRLRRTVKSACLRAETRKGQDRELRTEDFFPSEGLSGYGCQQPPEKPSILTYPSTKVDDVVLPEGVLAQVKQIISAARVQEIVFNHWGFGDAYRTGQGISALFSGPSGTGKTLTAEAIAHELGLPMRVVLLSGMMDKYVGETEKHTAEVFRTASARKEVLVFDEADALFAARVSGSEEGSYYINSHINTLLREMDVFTGIVILTTNRFPEMDRAFERRIRWKLEFPSPVAQARELLWRKLLPGKAPVDQDVDFGLLGREYNLTGGLIRSAVLKAAYSAAADGSRITMRHLRAAAATELINIDDRPTNPIGFNTLGRGA